MARMPLPIQADLADIDAICGYLIAKPFGANPAELNQMAFGRRKLSALKFWGLIEDAGIRLRITERGRLVARAQTRVAALREVVAKIPPYASVIARAVQNQETIFLSSEVAAHWHQHFRGYTQLDILNYQIVCFFRLAEAADLGRFVLGRKGQVTRFELSEDDARAFVEGANVETSQWTDDVDDGSGAEDIPARDRDDDGLKSPAVGRGNRVFITHRMNKKIAAQVNELLAFGKFVPVVVRDRETAELSPHDLTDEMRGCDTAVIHVGLDVFDGRPNEEPRVRGDVLIEIVAAMALYGRNFILLVEDGVTLPSNLQGPCECRYSGEQLDMPATMTLFKAFNDFTRSRLARSLAFAVGTRRVAPHMLQYERIGTSAMPRIELGQQQNRAL
jgi:5-carboxymethyl-2-hydroxymuconate isomerase